MSALAVLTWANVFVFSLRSFFPTPPFEHYSFEDSSLSSRQSGECDCRRGCFSFQVCAGWLSFISSITAGVNMPLPISTKTRISHVSSRVWLRVFSSCVTGFVRIIFGVVCVNSLGGIILKCRSCPSINASIHFRQVSLCCVLTKISVCAGHVFTVSP